MASTMAPAGVQDEMREPATVDRVEPDYLPLSTLRKQISDYESTKRDERDEAEEARRYYNGDQWTSAEVQVMRGRNQPIVTYNRIRRKINGVVGVVERLRQDPKAFPRTPQHQNGADVATAVLNDVLDTNQWKALSPAVAKDGAIEPIAGIELSLEPGDRGDLDVALHYVEPDTVFYDPRASREDFSDARYMGIAKWVAVDEAVLMFSESEVALKSAASYGSSFDMLTDTDRQRKVGWADQNAKHVRLVEHWYKRGRDWLYQFYCGDIPLAQGVSPFIDEKGQTFCRFILFSANVDHDNDRHGFIRDLKGAQDEINHRRSKGIHALHSWRITVEQGTVDDIEALRTEAHRPDAVLALPSGAQVKFENNIALMQGNLEMLNEAKQEIENFGPNPAQATGVPAGSSGRAIQLLQQAGISELGPYILGYRDWKNRVYRAVWNTVQRYWTAERFIRVTDDDGLAQFLKVNALGFDPQTNQPTIENALGSLDVDIIIDEGPDHTTLMEDTLDALMQLAPGMAQAGKPIPPEIIIELASLPQAIKKKILGYLQQSSQPPQETPEQQAAKQLQFADAQAKVRKTGAEADRAEADAMLKRAQAGNSGALAEEHAVHTAGAVIDMAHTHARTRQINADTAHSALGMLGVPQAAPQPAQPGF